jgi:hypothetical protein
VYTAKNHSFAVRLLSIKAHTMISFLQDKTEFNEKVQFLGTFLGRNTLSIGITAAFQRRSVGIFFW